MLLTSPSSDISFFNLSKFSDFNIAEANKFMNTSYKEALKASGAVSPNPFVGAAVVKNGKLLATSFHKEAGGSHAEVEALNGLSNSKTSGADLYVTLEPCCHFGKTPPCTNLIIEKKIARVFIGMKDPNPLVAGKGINQLKKAGIKVYLANNSESLRILNQPFLKSLATKSSYLVLKAALTLDGKMATRSGSSKWITNAASLAQVDYIRSKVASILIGENTLVLDDPTLGLRTLSNSIATSFGPYSPYRLALVQHLENVSHNLSFFSAHKDNKSVLILPQKYKGSKLLLKFRIPESNLIFYPGKKASLSFILKETYKMGINSILLEGGASLIKQAFSEEVIDMGQFFIAPKILGDNKGLTPFNFSSFKNYPPLNIDDGLTLANVSALSYQDNCSFIFRQKIY